MQYEITIERERLVHLAKELNEIADNPDYHKVKLKFDETKSGSVIEQTITITPFAKSIEVILK